MIKQSFQTECTIYELSPCEKKRICLYEGFVIDQLRLIDHLEIIY